MYITNKNYKQMVSNDTNDTKVATVVYKYLTYQQDLFQTRLPNSGQLLLCLHKINGFNNCSSQIAVYI